MAEAVRGTMRGKIDREGTVVLSDPVDDDDFYNDYDNPDIRFVAWTFYKFATNKGSVTFRWQEYNGDSGCYAADALVVPASKAEIEKYKAKLGH